MPKQFPAPPLKVHPEDAVSHDDTPDDLAGLVWSGAAQEQIAEALRVRDHARSNIVAELLVMIRDAVPFFRRAVQDGIGADIIGSRERWDRLESSRPDSLTPDGYEAHRAVIAHAKAEYLAEAERDQAAAASTRALVNCYQLAPSLMQDGRSQAMSSEVRSSVDLQDMRARIDCFEIDHNLALEIRDGWPHVAAPQHESNRVVRLVTVAEPGLRTSSR